MPETYGAMPIPVAPPATTSDSISDPLIDVTLSYLQAYINAKLGAAWRAVNPGSLPVFKTNVNNPEDIEFNERDLPCLYLWRSGTGQDKPDREAEDIWFMRDQLQLFWVFPPARQAFRAFREQAVAGFAKLLHVAIEKGRDPSWVVAGDPDPHAARLGSVFPRYAGWDEMYLSRWQDKVMTVGVDGATKPRSYPAFYATIDVVECFERDPADSPANAGDRLTLSVNPADPLVVVARDLPGA